MPAYAEHILSPEEPTSSSETTSAQQLKGNFTSKFAYVDVVVSGMSGRFPESSSVKEFARNLYEGVDMVTDDDRRWTPGIFGLPTRSGKLPNLSHFDAAFFSVSPRQSHCMDPQLRLLLEVSHEAIFDAGIHPNTLRGKRIGVYVGVSSSESEEYLTKEPDKVTGYELTGCCRAMFANRLSYALDVKGPSFAVDTACSSALVALQTAWSAIHEGEIEGAIVAGSNLTLKPQSSLQFHSLNMLSKDGRCKAFDSRANGYVRSEAVTAVFLQRSKDAKRVYAHIVQAITNTDGHKSEGITFPSGAVQKQLLEEVYQRANVDPSVVSYVEAHGTGTKVGDPQEVNSIAEVFCNKRSDPLLIGSVKTNMGHSEPASGLCAMVKVLLAMQNQEIPGNLHFQQPNPEIPALNNGKIKVVSENTPWKGQYAAINCFGFGGANVHVLLKSPDNSVHSESLLQSLSPDRMSRSNSTCFVIPEGGVPRLVVTSGRTESSVQEILSEFQRNRNVYFATLLDSISEAEVSPVSFPYRGYTIVGGENDYQIMNVTECPSERKPLWLIFSGMGSQWTGCGKRLLELLPFSDVVQRCRSALLPLGVDVIDVITREEPDPMLSTTSSFVAIATVQVGLMEVLKSVGLSEFDGMIGHSVGELGCGYADGALTAEQTVLSAYWRGRAVEEATLPVGGMAAVGLSHEEVKKFLDKDSSVSIACHNSSNSVTISGLKQEVDSVVERLNTEGIFCRAVNSGGIAFHHHTLKKAAPRLLHELQKVILSPANRSMRWISSSVPESKWGSGVARKASPEYLVNNLVSPVLFSEALEKIPEGARVIEVSPHSLMQAILRRALPGRTMVPLIRKESKDILTHLLEALGKLYATGERLNLKALYYDEEFPVPVNTPSIASLVKWDHSVEWDVAKFSGSASKAEFKVDVDLNDQSFSFIEGHKIDGRVLFPATGYMTLVWKALGKILETTWDEMPVTFENVTLHQATVLSSSNAGATFIVRILLSKGEFEILAGETLAASGNIRVGAKDTPEKAVLRKLMRHSNKKDAKNSLALNPDEVYKELKLRGYEYGGLFKGIHKADLEGTEGELIWKSNWIPLLDTMLQFSLLGSSSKGLYLPTRIRKVVIDPASFKEGFINSEGNLLVPVNHNHRNGITMCPGIEIHGLKATMAPRRAPSDQPLLEAYAFFPYHLSKSSKRSEQQLSEESAVKLLLDVVIENVSSLKLKIAQQILKIPITNEPIVQLSNVALITSKVLEVHPLLAFSYTLCVDKKVLSRDELEELDSTGIEVSDKLDEHSVPKLNLLIMTRSDTQLEDLSTIASLGNQTFIMVDSLSMKENLVNIGLVEVASVEKYNLYLLRKPSIETKFDIFNISDSDAKFKWVEKLKEKVLSDQSNPLWLVSRSEPQTGLVGMVKCLRREPGGQKLRCIIDSQNFLKENSNLWDKMLAADLVFNIIQEGVTGSMRHLPLPSLDAKQSEHSYLNVMTRGDLSSLTWLSSPLPPQTEKETILCFVNYAPLNFRDIMLASGKLPPDALPGNLAQKECILGLEFAGKTEKEERVMGLVAAGGLATTVRADPLLTWRVPSTWSLKEASTVPVVYATAYYALIVRGDLQKGESVLIHAGSGGVGQAAISIALFRGCTVFTTVSSVQKKEFLKERFPQLKDENFANSRDLTFEYHVMEHTNGDGVDVVLNSLAGELLQASVRCLKEHGRFLEIGKADLANNTSLGMSVFLKNVTFHGILLDALFQSSAQKRKHLQEIVYQGMQSGEVKPLQATFYNHDAAEEAFRFMASGKHIGKVILELSPDESTEIVTEYITKGKKRSSKRSSAEENNSKNYNKIPSVFRLWPKSSLVYVLTGGLGGLGLELANWLISRGASKLVLTSRRGVSTGYQALCIKRWRSLGIAVRILKQDASTLDGAEKLLKEAAEGGPVGGIFHLAMVLEDSILENQSSDKFERVSTVKADGSKQLDIASRKLCPNLHLWVTFSSVACGKGNAGQSNYGWANSVSERVVEQRVADGLPGCAIQWGGIADVGVLADTLGNVEVGGSKPQSVRSVLASLDNLIGSEFPVVGSICLSSKKSSSGKDGKGSKSLVSSIANILGIRDLSKAPVNVSLGDLGLDSLMAVEIKQTLEREIDLVMTTEQIRDLTLKHLSEIGDSGISEGVSNHETTSENKSQRFSWLDYPLIATDAIKILNENSSKKAPLFVASPIQGTCDVLSQVAENVDTKVIGLQYPETLPSTDFVQLATSLIKEIEKIEPTGPIHIGGYSFGASVAVEMVNQLEQKGRKPISLVLVDGSHSYVSGIISTYTNKYDVSAKEIAVSSEQENLVKIQGEADALVTYTLQFCLVDALQLKNDLLKLPSWNDRLNYVAKTVMDETSKKKIISPHLTKDQIVRSTRLFYDRLSASFYHDSSSTKISTPTLLVRATDNTHLADFGKDYGLSKVATGALTVKEVDGTHESIIFGDKGKMVAQFLNDFLAAKN